ncbi:PQQ-like beta-propeller repeat protein [Actinoplanes sp. TRM 88003]|uniref:PQQ-like beta-propeller repeat protein n=1 Tax=Paractinoplanes aksuensis TaxID=2939490 RepID=A0ABT1DM56_9ACTN|nr:PQQ-binding-like beta-propeller repeat protein [Actinoplanes aksuensis]MCO8271923.1 PQQ-like beta-propeller repeat protein [Actinoplanes aksuensis]
MPTDLDDLFGDLSRTADTIPLAPAEQARRRGRQRNRNQALVAAAVVALVAVGVSVAVRPRPHETHPAGLAPPLTEVGSPFEFGGRATFSLSSIDDDRFFTGWRAGDGTVKVVAANLHSNQVVWPARTIGRFDDFSGVTALPQALLVFTVPDRDAVPLNDTNPDREIHVLDPADGRERWKFKAPVADDLLLDDKVLVRTSAQTGRTEAFDWKTGATRWSLPPGDDRPAYTVGLRTADDINLTRFTGDRMVQVTRSGQVRMLNVADGRLLRTTTIPAPREGYTFVAYEGWLYNYERSGAVDSPFRVRATDLSTGNTSVVFDAAARHTVSALWPCGSGRICLSDADLDQNTLVRTVEVASRKQLWQVEAGRGGAFGSSMRGYTLLGGSDGATVIDANGRSVYTTRTESLDWLSDDALLAVAADGTVSRLQLADGRPTALGRMPMAINMCVNNETRMVCPSETEVRVWSLTG